ncbi:trehalose utilization protein ThuA [Natronorubrum sp. JWXQ-INN-674]|uniref:Trehalose utilization protein ThuA n=1 Tax=Natronorubrum halalkaliphilum TaxID=2691917 RepID=A0A6B0VMN8_9EURY|nr:ThuA domain-containing protein [Natronorubrum halalkaliphilum]MXV62306.1 trehalose utilization protein ThuA [Natronorubrum halalkaliphilum]
MTRVTIWNEFRHEREDEDAAAVYPDGIHETIADGLRNHDGGDGTGRDDATYEIRTATLDEPQHGLTDAVLEETDVLLWWGHEAHDEVSDAVAERVQERVLEGMGLVVLHSGHYSKPFKRLMGTTCSLQYREDGATERLWVVDPGHPIADGLEEYLELPRTEMYGEPFDVPEPDRLVFNSWFEGGEVFRSGCCYRRGNGRIFYFRPGHETYPIYENETVQRVLRNAVDWASPTEGAPRTFGERE